MDFESYEKQRQLLYNMLEDKNREIFSLNEHLIRREWECKAWRLVCILSFLITGASIFLL